MKVKKKTSLGLSLPLSGLLPAGVECLLSTWLGKLFMVVAHWALLSGFHVLLLTGLGNLLLCLLPAEEVGVRLTPHWGRGWVARILPTGGVVGFLWLLPSGEWLLNKNK